MEEKFVISGIKADVGSIGGHTKPSEEMLTKVKEIISGAAFLTDFLVTYTGDDICIWMVHQSGKNHEEIHKLAWDAFQEATKVAKSQGLYGAGQDLLKDAFSGNVRGLGPAVCEMEFKKRGGEVLLLFAADKTDPGTYNTPFLRAFADPFYSSALILKSAIKKGFSWTIMDMSYSEGDRVIVLNTPEDYYDICALLRDPQCFAIESVFSRHDPNEQAIVVSTSRLHNIAGTYTGKDDPIAIVRSQGIFPATEIIQYPFSKIPFVGGDAMGSHNAPLTPMPINTPVDFVYCCPIVSLLAVSLNDQGKMTHTDLFAGTLWNPIRDRAVAKFLEMREQGFIQPATLPYGELEYGGIREIMERLEPQFIVR